ncbi:MAG: hypothetical protein AB7V77_01820 [Candidatus Woesearchaeota archaeon]
MGRNHKLISKEARKKRRLQIFMSIFLAIIMLGSIFGIWATSYTQNEIIEYSGYKFKLKENSDYSNNAILVSKINDKEYFFYTNPNIAMNIKTEGNVTDLLSSNYLIFTVNPNDKIAQIPDAIRYEFSKLIDKQIYPAIDAYYEGYEDFPIIDCNNATKEIPVIYFKDTNTSTNFTVENNCLIINLRQEEIAYARDKLLLNILGIN